MVEIRVDFGISPHVLLTWLPAITHRSLAHRDTIQDARQIVALPLKTQRRR
jgi:hypothetical protein